MPTEKHTSETVWTWTINELCRKVEPVAVQVIYGLSPNQKIDPFLATQTRQWLVSFQDAKERAKIK